MKDVEHGIMYNRSFQTQESGAGAGAGDAKTLALIVQLGAGRSNKVCSIKTRTKGANFSIGRSIVLNYAAREFIM